MISLRQATSAYTQPGQPISIAKIVASLPLQTARPISVSRVARLLNRGGAVARLGGLYSQPVNQLDLTSDGLVGLVDLHTHPAANLGFGTNLFFGPPDGDPAQVFVDCKPCHGDPLASPQGNFIRAQVVQGIAGQDYTGNWKDGGVGWPDLADWPNWHDRLHQQVRVEALQRAWQGGLRVIVAHAVNSHTLAALGQTIGPFDDKSSGDLQIAAIKQMVAGWPFMELALSSADLRDIVGRGHLAVIIGVELDCLGNFYSPGSTVNTNAPFNPTPSAADIQAEVSRLHAAGVRYVFPVHLTDNVFGGAALYNMAFDTANRYQFGSFYAAETAPTASDIGFALDPGSTFDVVLKPQDALVLETLGFDPNLRPPTPPGTHRNSRHLQPAGQELLSALMGLGMMIDIDHMGENTMRDTLQYTQTLSYPVFAGHCGVRPAVPSGALPPPDSSERSHQISDATTILQRGGMWGVGITGGLASVHATIQQLRAASSRGGLAFGSDCSGLEHLPAPRYGGQDWMPDQTEVASIAEDLKTVVYRDYQGAPPNALVRATIGNRQGDTVYWGGFSHIGMYPDFLEDGISSGLLTQSDLSQLFEGPEFLAQAWAACENASRQAAPQPQVAQPQPA